MYSRKRSVFVRKNIRRSDFIIGLLIGSIFGAFLALIVNLFFRSYASIFDKVNEYLFSFTMLAVTLYGIYLVFTRIAKKPNQ